MKMKTAFCCVNLRTATLIVGCISLAHVVRAFVVIVLTGIRLLRAIRKSRPTEIEKTTGSIDEYEYMFVEDEHEQNISLDKYLWIFFVSVETAKCAAVICLLYGSFKKRRAFLLPYILLYSALLTLRSLHLVFRLVTKSLHSTDIKTLIESAIGIYFICIVWSLYEELCSEGTPPGTTVEYAVGFHQGPTTEPFIGIPPNPPSNPPLYPPSYPPSYPTLYPQSNPPSYTPSDKQTYYQYQSPDENEKSTFKPSAPTMV